MRVAKFNISKPRKFNTKDGIEKTQWNNVGMMTEFHKDDGTISRIIEIPAISLEANLFPLVERDKAASAPAEQSATGEAGEVEHEINPDDIPF